MICLSRSESAGIAVVGKPPPGAVATGCSSTNPLAVVAVGPGTALGKMRANSFRIEAVIHFETELVDA